MRAGNSHLVGLQTLRGTVAAGRDEVFAVVPQEAVGHRPDLPLRPSGHLFPRQRAPVHRPVHGVEQDTSSVREVLDRVHSDAGVLGEHPEQQPRVGHHLLYVAAVGGQQWQDVRDEVSHPVVTQVDAEVGEESPLDFQQVPPLEAVRSFGRLRRCSVLIAAPGQRCLGALWRQQDGQLDVGEEEEFLQEEGERVQHDEVVRSPSFL